MKKASVCFCQNEYTSWLGWVRLAYSDEHNACWCGWVEFDFFSPSKQWHKHRKMPFWKWQAKLGEDPKESDKYEPSKHFSLTLNGWEGVNHSPEPLRSAKIVMIDAASSSFNTLLEVIQSTVLFTWLVLRLLISDSRSSTPTSQWVRFLPSLALSAMIFKSLKVLS